jgi:hypothetical protein
LFEGTKLRNKIELAKFFFKKREKKPLGSPLGNAFNRSCGKKNFAVRHILRIFAIAYWNIFIVKK